MNKKITYLIVLVFIAAGFSFLEPVVFNLTGVFVTEKRMLLIRDSLQKYYVEQGSFPSGEKGLQLLVMNKYLKEKDVKDFWGRKYEYLITETRPFVLVSFGSDGKPGGTGWKKDISSIEVFEKENSALLKKIIKERNKMTDTLPDVVETADLIFQRIYEKNGSIRGFEWKNNLLSVDVCGCYPEEIVFDRSCAVSSAGKSAEFKADFKVTDEYETVYGEEDGALNAMNYQMVLRNSLAFCGALIQSESIWQNKSQIRFFTSPQNLGRCLQCCYNCTASSLWHEADVSIQRCGTGFIVETGFAQGIKADFSILYLLSSYASIFSLDENVPLNLETIKKQNLSANFERQLVGQLQKTNGTVNNFFKYADGSVQGETYETREL